MFFKANSTFIATFLTAILALMLFLAANGGLIFFFDSAGYHMGADVLLGYLRGEDMSGGLSFIGRSIYYGLLMQWELAYASFAPVQVLSVAWLLAIANELILGMRRPVAAAAITAIVCLLTPLPFFAINEMPDVYAGLAVLGAALFLAYGERMRRSRKAGLIVVLVLAVLFHQTHLLLLGGFTVIAGIGLAVAATARLGVGRAAVARLLPLVGVVLVGIAGEIAFRTGMEGIQGEPPMRRPFILGRMIADGPGYRYLKAHCPEEGWVMCDHMQNLPINIDWFLWSAHPDRRVYTAMTRDERRQLEREEFTLVGRIIAALPGSVLASAGHNWRRQLDMFTVEDFYYAEVMVKGVERSFGSLAGDLRSQRIVTSKDILASFSVMQGWLVYTAMAGIVILSLQARTRGDVDPADDRLFRLFAGLLVCGLLMNGAVCGMLSEPHHRYQARVIWLLPYAAMLYAALWWRWRRTAPSA